MYFVHWTLVVHHHGKEVRELCVAIVYCKDLSTFQEEASSYVAPAQLYKCKSKQIVPLLLNYGH